MGKIERQSAYGKYKQEQEEMGPMHPELTPKEKIEFQELIKRCEKQIAKDKKEEHHRYKALGHGSVELYMLKAKKIITITQNKSTFAIISERIPDYQLWCYYYSLYREAVAKKNYAEKKKLEDLDKSKL